MGLGISEHGENLVKLTRLGAVNAYLVREPDGLTMVEGDAYSTLGGANASSRVNPRFPFPGFVTWDRAVALRTAHELRALGPSRLAVGHGGVLEAPAAEMDRAIALAS
jgi:hypothetical protein